MASSTGAVPPFSLDKAQFDLTTWFGRTSHFFSITNPRYLFVSDADINAAKSKLDQFKAGTLPKGTPHSELWGARTLCDAVLHSDTKEPVPTPFRVCAFVPANVPICAGMLMMPQTPFNVVFWQWVNQSYNAGFNYCNRNASSSLDNQTLGTMYLSATALSVTMAIGLGKAVKKAPISPGTAALLGRIVPYCAVAGANVFNICLMRSGELKSGIEVKDESGKVVGVSKEAAKAAITQAAITRALMPAPVLLVPPVIMQLLDKCKLPPRIRPAVEFSVIIGCVAIALPAAIGVFPQEASIAVNKLEPELQQELCSRSNADGSPITNLLFNKGV
mmetsp:Transcript_38270/g.78469  ORF Transcript_38270/g.78469 Transcript_38270/m.78469 type:complete len:332 (+) Transcript_38270:38-1033(+)